MSRKSVNPPLAWGAKGCYPGLESGGRLPWPGELRDVTLAWGVEGCYPGLGSGGMLPWPGE